MPCLKRPNRQTPERNAAVRLDHLRLRDFRNYAYLDAAFGPGFHLFLGNNAQGKTNLLEAIYLLATLRSFRGATGAQMISEVVLRRVFAGTLVAVGGWMFFHS